MTEQFIVGLIICAIICAIMWAASYARYFLNEICRNLNELNEVAASLDRTRTHHRGQIADLDGRVKALECTKASQVMR